MSVEIDHLFILTDVGAPAAEQLVAAGFIEGTSRVHPGQGTTNRRFFFDNVMLEFLWVHDADEAASAPIKPTHLLERWQARQAGASPFGVCFRSNDGTPPFPAWDYQPPYLPDELTIKVAHNAKVIGEPFLFHLPWAQPPDATTTPNHPVGVHVVTEIGITSPPPHSAAVDAMRPWVQFEDGAAHQMTVTFDDHKQAQTLDLRPSLPLLLQY